MEQTRYLTRRGLLRGAAAVAGLSTVGLVAGCSTLAKSASPTKKSAPVVITYAPWGQWTEIGSDWQKYMQPAINYFQEQPANKGIQVQIVAPGGAGHFGPTIASGVSIPDVFEDWLPAYYLSPTGNLVMNLDKLMQEDGIKKTLWSPGQMNALSTESGTYFLPCYVDVAVFAVNLSNLDALGLQYPDPEWDYQAAQQAFQAATLTKGTQQYIGATLIFPGNFLAAATTVSRAYAFHAFNAPVMDSTRTQCLLDSAEALQALQWWDTLYWDKIAGGPGLDNGSTYVESGSNTILSYFEQYTGFNWTYFPVPKYPNGQVAFESTDFHAINILTKHPDEAWQFLKFVSADPYWANYTMKMLLRPPGLLSAWDNFPSIVESVVGSLAQKVNVQYYVQAAQEWGYAGRIFKYEDEQAMTLLNTALSQVLSSGNAAGLASTMTAAVKAVNTLEQQAIAAAASTTKSSASSSSTSSSSGSSASSSSTSSSSKSGG